MRLIVDPCNPETVYADLCSGEELTDELREKAFVKVKDSCFFVEFHRKVDEHPRWLETWGRGGDKWYKIK